MGVTDAPKECPTCRLVNPPSATHCDCGYDFEKGEDSPEVAQAKQELGGTLLAPLLIGPLLLGLGGLGIAMGSKRGAGWAIAAGIVVLGGGIVRLLRVVMEGRHVMYRRR